MGECKIPGPACGTLDPLTEKGTTNKQHSQPPGPIGVQPVKRSTCKPTVTIGRVFRGNPYIDHGLKAAVPGLPDSVPPGKTYDIEIEVKPSLDSDQCAPGQFIELSIDNNGTDDNGTASLSHKRITRTTTVTVTGGKQTKADFSDASKFAGKLKIQAKLDGTKVVAESQGFSVCAHPLNWEDKFDSDVEETLQGLHVIGMNVKTSWVSDAGDMTNLNGVRIREVVGRTRPPEPPFHDFPFDTSGYELGNASGIDRHTVLYPNDRPDATWIMPQLSLYKCLRCGCVDIVMPNSGLNIVNRVSGGYFYVEKVAANVKVSGQSAKAGVANNVRSQRKKLVSSDAAKEK